jgi:hypothetical protein
MKGISYYVFKGETMETIIAKIALGLVSAAILGLIKMYSDLNVVKARHDGLQKELKSYKKDVKEDMTDIRSSHKTDIDNIRNLIEERFTKVEALIEKLYLYEMDKDRR